MAVKSRQNYQPTVYNLSLISIQMPLKPPNTQVTIEWPQSSTNREVATALRSPNNRGFLSSNCDTLCLHPMFGSILEIWIQAFWVLTNISDHRYNCLDHPSKRDKWVIYLLRLGIPIKTWEFSWAKWIIYDVGFPTCWDASTWLVMWWSQKSRCLLVIGC